MQISTGWIIVKTNIWEIYLGPARMSLNFESDLDQYLDAKKKTQDPHFPPFTYY